MLCLDEPFNSLDRPLGLELLDLLRRELEDSATSAILVTHQLEEAQAFAHRLAVLHRGQILQVGHPRELVLQPASREVAELVGYRGWLSSGSQTLALHPDRIHPVGAPDRRGDLGASDPGGPPGSEDGARARSGGALARTFPLSRGPISDGRRADVVRCPRSPDLPRRRAAAD